MCHRRLGRLIKRSLKFKNRKNVNGVAFNGSFEGSGVCAVAVWKSQPLACPKKAKHAKPIAPYLRLYGGHMGPFKSTAHGGYKFVSKFNGQLHSTSAALSSRKGKTVTRSHLTVILRTLASVRWRWGIPIHWLARRKPNTPKLLRHLFACTEVTWAPSN